MMFLFLRLRFGLIELREVVAFAIGDENYDTPRFRGLGIPLCTEIPE